MDPRRKKILLFGLVGGVVLLTAGFTVWKWAEAAGGGWSGLTFNTNFQAEGIVLSVSRVSPSSPAERAGLREGDRILAINGVPVNDSIRLARLWSVLHPGDDMTLTLVEKGNRREVTLRLADPLAQPEVVCLLVLNFSASLVFLGIGGLVFWKRSEDSRTLLFFVLCTLYGLLRLLGAGPMYAYTLPFQENLFILVLSLGLVSFLFPPLLHLCLIFPRRRPVMERHPFLTGWIYGVPLVLGSLTMGLLLLGMLLANIVGSGDRQVLDIARTAGRDLLENLRTEAWIPAILFGGLLLPAGSILRRWWRTIRTAGLSRGVLGHPWLFVASVAVVPLWIGAGLGLAYHFMKLGDAFGLWILLGLALFYGLLFLAGEAVLWLVFPIAACVALIRGYRQAGVEERQQIRWPLWGILLAVAAFFFLKPFVALWMHVFGIGRGSSLYGVLDFVRQNSDTLFLLLIPLSFAFAILKYRLMEISVYIRRTLVYGILTAALSLLFLLLIGGLGGLLTRLTGVRNEWVAIGATLVAVLSVVPLRNRVQAAVDRRFFRRKHDYAMTLQVLSREVAASGDLRRLLQVVVDRLQEALLNRSVVVFLRREGEQLLRAEAMMGLPDERLGTLRFPGDGPLAAGLDAIRPPESEALTVAERRMLAAAGGALLVPVRHRGELRAVVALGSKLSDEAFDQQDLDFLSAAAGQISIGLENLRLEDQQREFEKAREIQQGLLPREIPRIPGFQIAGAWQPARSVGGDYFDIFPLGEDRLALVIADVSGKGLAAALLMSNLQAAVKAFAAETVSTRELCERVNRMICGHIMAGKFITFFYGILDTRTRTLRYTNAGHNPPLLRSAGGRLQSLDRGGTVLGLFRDTPYEDAELALQIGDRLLLFTDGLSEAANDLEEEFGEGRLAALLATAEPADAEALKESVLRSVTEFCNGDFRDDATLIVVQVTPV
jgi:serine phosphatase RsbU (regulator of sigma subunit)